jgi:DNA-binding transcriptional MerR regulator
MSFLTTKAVAVKAGLTPDAIRWHERQGNLLALKVERSPGVFMRLFVEEDVERFLRQREARELARANNV